MVKCPEGQTRNAKTKQCRDKLKAGKKGSPKNTTRKPSSKAKHSGETTSAYVARMAKKLSAQLASAERKIGSRSLKKSPKGKKPSSRSRHSGETTSGYIARMAKKLNAQIASAERKIGSKTLKSPKGKKPSSKAKHSGETTSAYVARMARKLSANISAAFSKKKAKNNAKSYKHKKD